MIKPVCRLCAQITERPNFPNSRYVFPDFLSVVWMWIMRVVGNDVAYRALGNILGAYDYGEPQSFSDPLIIFIIPRAELNYVWLRSAFSVRCFNATISAFYLRFFTSNYDYFTGTGFMLKIINTRSFSLAYLRYFYY